MATAAKKAVTRRVITPPPPGPVAPTEPTVELSGETVLMVVPKSFILTDDDGKQHQYPVGTYKDTPIEHAEHWYAVANGAVIK